MAKKEYCHSVLINIMQDILEAYLYDKFKLLMLSHIVVCVCTHCYDNEGKLIVSKIQFLVYIPRGQNKKIVDQLCFTVQNYKCCLSLEILD